jgi:predicted nucleotidyltransferase
MGDDRMSSVLAPYQHAIEALCRQYHVRRLELFGSVAAGDDRPGESDIDFVVEFEPMPHGGYADAYFGLLKALEALFQRPVDLIVDSAIKNPYFRQSVDESKVLIYAA